MKRTARILAVVFTVVALFGSFTSASAATVKNAKKATYYKTASTKKKAGKFTKAATLSSVKYSKGFVSFKKSGKTYYIRIADVTVSGKFYGKVTKTTNVYGSNLKVTKTKVSKGKKVTLSGLKKKGSKSFFKYGSKYIDSAYISVTSFKAPYVATPTPAPTPTVKPTATQSPTAGPTIDPALLGNNIVGDPGFDRTDYTATSSYSSYDFIKALDTAVKVAPGDVSNNKSYWLSEKTFDGKNTGGANPSTYNGYFHFNWTGMKLNTKYVVEFDYYSESDNYFSASVISGTSPDNVYGKTVYSQQVNNLLVRTTNSWKHFYAEITPTTTTLILGLGMYPPLADRTMGVYLDNFSIKPVVGLQTPSPTPGPVDPNWTVAPLLPFDGSFESLALADKAGAAFSPPINGAVFAGGANGSTKCYQVGANNATWSVIGWQPTDPKYALSPNTRYRVSADVKGDVNLFDILQSGATNTDGRAVKILKETTLTTYFSWTHLSAEFTTGATVPLTGGCQYVIRTQCGNNPMYLDNLVIEKYYDPSATPAPTVEPTPTPSYEPKPSLVPINAAKVVYNSVVNSTADKISPADYVGGAFTNGVDGITVSAEKYCHFNFLNTSAKQYFVAGKTYKVSILIKGASGASLPKATWKSGSNTWYDNANRPAGEPSVGIGMLVMYNNKTATDYNNMSFTDGGYTAASDWSLKLGFERKYQRYLETSDLTYNGSWQTLTFTFTPTLTPGIDLGTISQVPNLIATDANKISSIVFPIRTYGGYTFTIGGMMVEDVTP